METALSRVPHDVWLHIIHQCRNPTPAPHSRPPRSALKQPVLCALMRVSRLFQSLVEPLLYTHIITDSLPRFALCIGTEHQPARLRHTRTLRIEYSHRVSSAAVNQPGTSEGELCSLLIAGCKSEVRLLAWCLGMLLHHGMHNHFPQLESIAVGSIYAGDDDGWGKYRSSLVLRMAGRHASDLRNEQDKAEKERDNERGDEERRAQRCSMLFGLWLRSGNLRHLCARDSDGPLGIEHLIDRNLLDSTDKKYICLTADFTRTTHFTSKAGGLPLPRHGKVRWISEAPAAQDFAEVLDGIGRCCNGLINLGSGYYPHGRHRYDSCRCSTPPDCEVDIYCSTAQYGQGIHDESLVRRGLGPVIPAHAARHAGTQGISAEEQAEMVGVLQERITKLFRSKGESRDKFRWMISAETPVCEACGSGPPM